MDRPAPAIAALPPSKTTLSRSATPVASTRTTRGATPAQPAPPAPVASTSAAPAPPAAPSPDVAEQLRLMNARLESLESTLSRAHFAPAAPGTPRVPGLAPQALAAHKTNSLAGSESSPMTGVTPQSLNATHETQHDGVGVNAVETAGEAMAVEGLVDLGAAQDRNNNGHGPAQAMWESVKPDVLGRGIMTLEECDAEFDFYFENIQPWTALLSTTLDRHPLVVRERSPLLFHAILLITLYYRPRTSANIILYRAVSSILDSILAPQILCPQPDQLSFDFVRAVHLLLMYKPVQYSSLNARGISDTAQIESASKMNVRASWMLRLLVSRVSAFIGLPSIATTFAQAFANQHITPIPDEIISQQRLYLGCVFHESHGALQSGKSANFVPQDACRTTRLFAQLRRQPSDVRLAASVELVAHAATALNARTDAGVLEDADLRQFDDEMDAWHEYWAPLLESVHAHDGDDSVAWSLFYPYASFTRLTVRGFAFNKWKAERKARALAARGSAAPPGLAAATLGEDERESIAKAVEVAHEMMLAISTEGRELRSGRTGAKVQWRNDAGPLVPDPEVVRMLKWATDSLTCVMFSYPLIFLAKLANEGLLRSDLTVIAHGSTPLPSTAMSPEDKLCRLFQLGADLLDAIAPNPHHPSVRQAAFLRKVWDAGISGRRSITSAPSSPRLGAQAGNGPVPPIQPQALSQQLQQTARAQAAQRSAPQPPTLAPPVLAPATLPPPPQSAFTANIAATGSAAAALSSYTDFSLSAAYQPTPIHSPPFGAQQGPSIQQAVASSQQAGQSLAPAAPLVEDPFAALLSGVSPSIFDAGQSFFSLDGGIDWPSLNGGPLDGMGGGGSGGFSF
ncbi:hypothetical protein Rhopal_000533-T1 [Rhodotorula paludigena]|uniref:Transcription factor domain-containing protein n=1 Tax=Rhodotorula paludigena TaxID=86838 RepID=A0AAV5GAY5_9BASI|nr:hypothetical protein Rhopal_000533-T1 [Rhodotorula paludigena]